MIYDAFAHLPIYGLEDLGFVGRGLEILLQMVTPAQTQSFRQH